MQANCDAEMSLALRCVGQTFDRHLKSFDVYDVNGYRFRTRSYEEKRGNLKTTCTGVRTPSTDGLDYYGIVEQILELDFGKFLGCKPVMFKCHWFDPEKTKKDLKIGLIEI